MCNLSDLIEEEALEKGIKTGMETGIKRGSERMAVLTRKLIEDNRMEELLKATEEEAFREKLYQEYKIE